MEITMTTNKNEALVMMIANFGSRLIDKEKPMGKTNIGTVSGTTLIGIGVPMVSSGETTMVIAGALLCAAGVGLIWYKEYKENEAEEAAEEKSE